MGPLPPLPIYPSTQARRGLSASQLAQLHANLSDALARVIALPPAKQNAAATRAFVASYAGDRAHQSLRTLIWEDTQAGSESHDGRLPQRVLILAEKIASSTPGLDPRTLLDLSVAFPSRIGRLRTVLSAALDGTPDLPATFASDIVPAFTSTLSRSSGLYALRKTARCLTGLLRPSPPALVRPFAHSREFMVALARAYDDGLTAIARSYGGIRTNVNDRKIDDWERIWLDTKVDIVDGFHLIVTTMVQDILAASGAQLAAEADRTFGIVFALLDVTQESRTLESADPVPFLNRPLIADYEYGYELNETLCSALRRASHEDARVELLESMLRRQNVASSGGNIKDPGALRLILRSSDPAPGASGKATQNVLSVSADKGKAKAMSPEPPPHNAALDSQVIQVLDIFPDRSPEYIRKLLTHPSFPFRSNPERVIEALLEGTAPNEDALGESFAQELKSLAAAPAADASIERRNVFDQEAMDLSRVHIGKKTQDVTSLITDKAETERMKAEILRLAETMSVDSDEGSGGKALDVFDLDDDPDETGASTIRVLGDGEGSDDEDGSEGGVKPMKPETMLELAYIRDPRLFDRDAQTRRDKPRADLKRQTGWTDEQIEGWRIMLERNPKKDRILAKHEFSGNRTAHIPIIGGAGNQPGDGQRGGGGGAGGGGGRGRGWGRGRGRGRGRGGGGRGGEEKTGEVMRERAFKEKHKSDTRKRGHGKKMARAGGPSA